MASTSAVASAAAKARATTGSGFPQTNSGPTETSEPAESRGDSGEAAAFPLFLDGRSRRLRAVVQWVLTTQRRLAGAALPSALSPRAFMAEEAALRFATDADAAFAVKDLRAGTEASAAAKVGGPPLVVSLLGAHAVLGIRTQCCGWQELTVGAT